MNFDHVEEYLGAIYRLREGASIPLPLPRLQEYFNFTLISVHEMVRKLEGETLASYVPYHGVMLTGKGEQIASSLVRRHRIWERFLADMLAIPWEATHAIAGQLEHAAPDLVTERLAGLMGEPEMCPHGSVIPPRGEMQLTGGILPSPHPLPEGEGATRGGGATEGEGATGGECLISLSEMVLGKEAIIMVISPEVPEYLCQLKAWGLMPGTVVRVTGRVEGEVSLTVNGAAVVIPHDLAQTVWTETSQQPERDNPTR